MPLLGIHLTLLVGRTVPRPAPLLLTEALDNVKVTHNDRDRSGFEITFKLGRPGGAPALEYPLLRSPLLEPGNRVILVVTLGVRPRVLIDGFITLRQMQPANEPGMSTLTVTGEDVSLMMDVNEETEEHPAQNETVIAYKLIGKYARYGLVPRVQPPRSVDAPNPVERIPVQQCTDREYLEQIGERHGHVFYVEPGPVPGVNVAYWGPPKRESGLPQKALSFNMGPHTNVESLDFSHDALGPERVEGKIQVPFIGITLPIRVDASTRPPLASRSVLAGGSRVRRSSKFRQSGLGSVQAFARAQARTDLSTDDAVTATGSLDAVRYGDVLEARRTVDLRGVGASYDGTYYVKSVTHSLRKGDYHQSFQLAREGVGALRPTVRRPG